MDNTVPAGAAKILQFIYRTEVSREAPECYEVIYGHNQKKLAKPITKMTIGEIQAAQSGWSRTFGSSATGAYQFMKATLAELIVELKLSPNTLFSGNLQDRLGYHLLKRRGYLEFMAGRITRNEFGKRLAREWASFPVLVATTGAHRKITRGQSFYAGDGLNKSLIKPEAVEKLLDEVKSTLSAPVAGAPKPEPEVTHVVVDAVDPKEEPAPAAPQKEFPVVTTAIFTAAVTTGVTVVTAAWDWFTAVPCNVLGIFCGN